MSFVKSLTLSACVVATLAWPAQSQVITQQLNLIDRQVSPGSPRVFDLPFSRFNAALGTLNSVSWSYSGNLQYLFRAVGGPRVFNGESGTFEDSFGEVQWFNRQVFLRDTTGAQIANPFVDNGLLQAAAFLAPNATTPNYPGYELRRTDALAAGTFTWNTPGGLAPFVGAGAGNVSVYAQIAQATNDSQMQIDGLSRINFTSTLTFNYTPRPANDACGSATVIGTGVFNGTTTNATSDFGNASSCAGTNDTIDVWYRLVAPCTGTATITTCSASTNFDTTLSVFSSCGGAEIVCNDDSVCSFNQFHSRASFPVELGTSYLVRVSGFNGATGNFQLAVELTPCPADYNADCTVDFFDYLDFAGDYAAELPRADVNADGQTDFFDYLDFAAVFSGGC
ncbi:MAG: hypothetical protein SFZ23_00765 [Planctomycetota bacterium]|nr:hypothetical protein [Planctomycetota bacterium]